MDNKSFNDELEGIDQDSSPEEAPLENTWSAWGEGEEDSRSETLNGKSSDSNFPPKVNVYDYEVSSFTDDQETTNGSQEMQERRGSAFLGGGLMSHHSMSQIPEEIDENGKEMNHVEHVN
jgi:hypothetical protein